VWQWIVETLRHHPEMALFLTLAATALAAGPDFLAGLQKSGLSLVIASSLLTVVPHVVTPLVVATGFE
jgi:uncharacterized transporter YbjL